MNNTTYAWYYINDKSTLEQRVERVSKAYREKFGIAPTVCLLHPEECKVERIGEMGMKPSLTVQRDNYFVGVE